MEWQLHLAVPLPVEGQLDLAGPLPVEAQGHRASCTLLLDVRFVADSLLACVLLLEIVADNLQTCPFWKTFVRIRTCKANT